jgi:hypothetical protein
MVETRTGAEGRDAEQDEIIGQAQAAAFASIPAAERLKSRLALSN